MLKTVLCAFTVVFFSSLSWANGNCIDSDRVQSEIFAAFDIRTEDAKLVFDACNSKNIIRKFAQAMLFIKDTPVEKAPAELDLGLDDVNPFSYFSARIKNVTFDASGNKRCGSTTMAYILSDERETLHICPYLNTFDTLTMASTLMHESRHAEGYPHARCDHGTMAFGTSAFACDKDYHDYKGSYAVGTQYEIRVATSQAVNPVVRQQARSRAVVSLLERFNKLPLDMKAGALVQADSGDVYFYDGESSEVIMQVPPQSLLTTRTSLPTFFDKASGQVQSYLYGSGFVDAAGEYAQNFRGVYTAQERDSLLDVSYTGDYSCLLFKTKLICGADADPDKELSLEGLRPVQFVSSVKSSMVEKDIQYIVTASGELYPLPMFWKDFQKMSPKDLKKSLKVQNLKSLGALGSQEIAITMTGSVLVLNEGKWAPPEGLPKASYKKIFAPYYWSKILEGLK